MFGSDRRRWQQNYVRSNNTFGSIRLSWTRIGVIPQFGIRQCCLMKLLLPSGILSQSLVSNNVQGTDALSQCPFNPSSSSEMHDESDEVNAISYSSVCKMVNWYLKILKSAIIWNEGSNPLIVWCSCYHGGRKSDSSSIKFNHNLVPYFYSETTEKRPTSRPSLSICLELIS